jgi:DNA helicase INO80
MSISQLLSSDNAVQQPSTVYSPTTETTAPAFEHKYDPIERRNNGIQNLLNSDTDEKYQMADSDTDTEDIALIRSPKVEAIIKSNTTALPTSNIKVRNNYKNVAAETNMIH